MATVNGTRKTKLQDCDWVIVRPKTDQRSRKYLTKAEQRTGKFKRRELRDAHSRISLEEANCIPLNKYLKGPESKVRRFLSVMM